MCRHEFDKNPKNGFIFVFINRSKTMVRLLAYEHNGFWLMTKRLSKGKFRH
ncbi:MAG: IS66 family insertion sequence element accessory protein TnpB, partial [Methylococcales bacterium]|nr:IS66 family insertion sequence element accessory protein TnpB [Methylococcales bacterium]